jgi:ABC-type bacteriocin/lantibiotic exporter with double-glycine peptidase domain
MIKNTESMSFHKFLWSIAGSLFFSYIYNTSPAATGLLKIKRHNESLFTIIGECLSVFYPAKKREFHLLLLTTFAGSLIDVASFTYIIPVIYLINNPDPIQLNPLLHFLYVTFSFSSSGTFILFLLVGLAFIFMLKNVLLFGCAYIQNKFIYSIASDLTDKQLINFYGSDYLDIRASNSTEYLRYLVIAPQEFARNLLYPFAIIVYEGMIILIIVVAFLVYYPTILLLIFMTIAPLSYALIRTVRKRLAEISQVKAREEMDSYKHTMEGITGYADIKLFGKEAVFSERIKSRFAILFSIDKKLNLYQWIPRRIIETLVILTVCILYGLTSVVLNIYPAKVVIILLTFATAAYRLMPSINEILSNAVRIKTSRYILHHLKMVKEVLPKPGLKALDFRDKIEWKEISFAYDSDHAMLLDQIDLTIKKGAFVVITGESGIGKSTIAKILTGLIKPVSGKYLIDGHEVEQFSQIRHLIGYVTQDFYMFDKSFVENIAIGESGPEIDLQRVQKVIEASNLSDFVSLLPGGLNYVIGERGAKLSGGQKQRIAIARALYKQAQILVLDEITSALDKDNEMEILDTIYRIARNEELTVIIITHRLTAVNKFDAHYELENGKLYRKNKSDFL